MVNKSLATLVMIAHDIDAGKTFTPKYFTSKGLGEEGRMLEENRFVEIITKDRKKSYSITAIGKEALYDLETYYNLILAEHS